MKDLADRVVGLVVAAFMGYLFVAVVGLSAIVLIAGVGYISGAPSFSVGLGPVPVMTYWRDGASWGFNSGWGLTAVSPIGAVVGLVLAIRRGMPGDRSAAQ